jgi:hypothetical protein
MYRFYSVGGGTRIAGFLLAVATVFLIIPGTGPIDYLRMYQCCTQPPTMFLFRLALL